MAVLIYFTRHKDIVMILIPFQCIQWYVKGDLPLQFRCTMDEFMIPKLVVVITDELDEGD